MNKKRQLQFNLNNFLLATSTVFDLVEKDINHTSTHHLKRVVFLSLKIGQKFNLSNEQLFDLSAYALCHSNALYEKREQNREYCEIGQENIKHLPFLTNEENIIKYSKELFDGSGPYGLKGEEIPLFSQIISFSDLIDTKFDLGSDCIDNRKEILEFIKNNEEKLYSLDMSEIFCDELAKELSFWLDLQNENQILAFIFQTLNDYTEALDFEAVLKITSVFTKMVDKESKLIEKAAIMADSYEFDHKDKETFLIAASLCTIGKLAIPQDIMKKIEELTSNEYEIIRAYPYYTKIVLSNIMGFNDIASWASNIQERLDGTGYPYCLEAKDLGLKERLLGTLTIYEALTKACNHEKALEIMHTLVISNKIDKAIVENIDKQFA